MNESTTNGDLRRDAVLFDLASKAALTARAALAATKLGFGIYVVADDEHDVERHRDEGKEEDE
jgi:hypothetical protein